MIYFHQFDPFLIQFSENVGIRWYGLAYLFGFLLCYLFLSYFYKIKKTTLTPAQSSDFIFWIALGVILGGRFGYVIFYDPELLWSFSSSFPYWKALFIQEGGMASHGGFIGVLCTVFIFAKRNQIKFLHLGDMMSISAALSLFFGRLANFINGELYGRVCDKCSVAVQFPSEMYEWVKTSPQKLAPMGNLIESLGWKIQGNGGISTESVVISEALWQKWLNSLSVQPWLSNNINYYVSRLILEVQNGNQEVISFLENYISFRHPSQIYQSLLEALIPFIILLSLFLKKKLSQGVIMGLFVFLYSVGRFIGEFFRMPDSHLGYRWLDLTQGQWLTVGFFLLSLGYLFWIYKKEGSFMAVN